MPRHPTGDPRIERVYASVWLHLLFDELRGLRPWCDRPSKIADEIKRLPGEAQPCYALPMPSIRGIPGPYRLFFYSLDCNEPVHVHAERDGSTCKFWLNPVALAASHGFTSRDLSAVRRIIFEYRYRIVEAWHEHCNASN